MELRRCLLSLAIAITPVLSGCSDLGRPLLPTPEPLVSASALDFGTVTLSDSVSREIIIGNTGTGPLAGSARVACPEYVIESGGGPFVVPPGGRVTVRLRFHPTAVGSFPCTLELGFPGPGVALSGAGALQRPGAMALAVPDSLDFGVLAAGLTATRTFKLFSVGTAPLLVNVVSTCGEFEVTSGSGAATLLPGGSVDVTVRFAPTSGQGHACALALGPGIPDINLTGFATTVSFAQDVQPIFQNCDGCHSFSDPASGYFLLTQDRIFTYAPGVRVIPFDLTNSVLYGKITNSGQYGQLMPEGGPLLPLADRNTIRDWILEGARNN